MMASARSYGLRQPRTGLTVIEVLVALALLSVVATAIIGSFSLVARLNRDASVDVDYSRVVRSVMERVGVVWQNTDRWEDGNAFIDDEETTVNDFVQALSEDCTAEVLPPVDGSAVVRVVRITCSGASGSNLAPQVFEMEFGSP
jgi:prepilin-type N-terminal cleavage/methylation domain-containing protein